MHVRSLLFALLILCSASSFSQDKSLYQKKFFIKNNDTLPYRLLLPLNYDPAKKYPLIVFLHGSGERGNDNELQLVHGADLFLKTETRNNFPAIVVFPQCAANDFWSNVQFGTDAAGKRVFNFLEDGAPTRSLSLVMDLLEQLPKEYRLEKKQFYIGGLSMGGMGTFEIVRRKPKMFAAAIAICGGGNPATAKKLKHTSWRVFHGEKDEVVPWNLSDIMVKALRKKHASVQFNLYPDATHNSWDKAFAEADLLPWLFAQKK
jgi:predicted peptidase